LRKAEKIMSLDDLLLQPWFLTKKTTRAIRSLLPPDFRQRLHDYFDDFGCLRCGRDNLIYRSNGMCGACFMLVFNRLQASARRRLKERPSRQYGPDFVAKADRARNLLRGLHGRAGPAPARPSTKSVKLSSPVIGAFDRYTI
jgi:hypothetical protein